MASKADNKDHESKPNCFVLMPISDPDGYSKGHFAHVYDDIICPACDKAGFVPIRADKVKESNLIHLDILQKLLEAPMAICDLSSRNANVLFELGIRQAFDKPVALIQEVGTPPIFDISPLRYSQYRKERTYHEVLEDQNNIAKAIQDTYLAYQEGKGVNSIVKLLSLTNPAKLPDSSKENQQEDLQRIILSELGQLRKDIVLASSTRPSPPNVIFEENKDVVYSKNPNLIDVNTRLDTLEQELLEARKLSLLFDQEAKSLDQEVNKKRIDRFIREIEYVLNREQSKIRTSQEIALFRHLQDRFLLLKEEFHKNDDVVK